jgi:hypothetical protein
MKTEQLLAEGIILPIPKGATATVRSEDRVPVGMLGDHALFVQITSGPLKGKSLWVKESTWKTPRGATERKPRRPG